MYSEWFQSLFLTLKGKDARMIFKVEAVSTQIVYRKRIPAQD
jgi:hypothetical protein